VNKQPISVTIISSLFIAAGTIGVVYHATELNTQNLFSNDLVWVLLIRLVAVVAGLITLLGRSWGRWLLLAWLAYHVFLSIFHILPELLMHGALLVLAAYILFHSKASDYFKNTKITRNKE